MGCVCESYMYYMNLICMHILFGAILFKLVARISFLLFGVKHSHDEVKQIIKTCHMHQYIYLLVLL
jgi:hypothetical protein